MYVLSVNLRFMRFRIVAKDRFVFKMERRNLDHCLLYSVQGTTTKPDDTATFANNWCGICGHSFSELIW